MALVSCISSMQGMKLKILLCNTQVLAYPLYCLLVKMIVYLCLFFVWLTGVNTGISVQIAIIHGEKSTTLHVNDYNITLNATPILLDSYSNKPWINPEKEVLAPQRPPAPPTDYFQVSFISLKMTHSFTVINVKMINNYYFLGR